MATSACYFDLVREMKDAYNHRLRLVESAKQRGIKTTPRLFATTVPPLPKWPPPFQPHGPFGPPPPPPRPRCSQRFTLLGLRPAAQRFGQRRVRLPHPAASGSLRRLAARSGLADRQRRRVQRRFSQSPWRQPACAHPPGRPHLSERRGNRASPRRRRILRPRRLLQPRRLPCQSAHLSALLQPRAPQLAQRKPEPLADHRAAHPPPPAPTLPASTRVPGLLP